jgi:hypothetical protein
MGALALPLAGLGVLAPTAASAVPLPANCTGTTTITCTFDYNGTTGSDGSSQTWTAPAGVTSAYFALYGAKGYGGDGGLGGETTGVVRLTPGTVVTINVGGAGGFGDGGFNGGGDGTGSIGFGGGGASDIRIGGTQLGNRLLIAGGGGAGAPACYLPACGIGGAGGGLIGGDGTSTPSGSGFGGMGGTQNGGGLGFFGATNGESGRGGKSADAGGGGGGGYFGGAGGGSSASASGAGGGGSSYFSPDLTRVTLGSTSAGMRFGNGLVIITYDAPALTPTTTTVISAPNPSTPGQSVTFTATVSPTDGSGTVGFFADGSSTAISGCDAVPLADNSGTFTAACTTSGLSNGNHPITAKYTGGGGFSPSSGNLNGGQTVANAAQNIAFLALPNRSIIDSPFTITGVTGGASGQPVTFTAAGPCTVNGQKVTLQGIGSCTVTAHQAGDATYQPAPDVPQSFTITGKPVLRIGDATTTEGNSGTHPMKFHITLSKAVSKPVTVQWDTANGSAKAPSDFLATGGILTFSPGQTSLTISVPVKGDHVKEPNESLQVLLKSPTKATIGDPVGAGVIFNDD